MKWYLLRENSFNRLDNLPAMDKLEFVDAINSVLTDRPANLTDCVKLSKNLCHRIFITNVEDANKVLIQMGRNERRYPISSVNINIARKFILASSLLFAKMFNIKDNNEVQPSEETTSKLISETPYSIPTSSLSENKIYQKPEKFVDLKFFSNSKTQSTISLKYPDDLSGIAIQPIAAFIDNPLVNQFIDSTIRLRRYNFQNKFPVFQGINSYHVHNCKLEFEFPYFCWSHMFGQLL